MANEFDKIIKENLKEGIDALIKNLGIQAIEKTFLDPKFQFTDERETDFLLKIKNAEDEEFILHLEFQSTNDKNMVYRMLRYCVFILQTYKLPIRQFVIFVGRNKLSMQNELFLPNIHFHYELINFKNIPYESFLESQNPSEIILAILGKFSEPERAVKEILKKLIQKINEETTLSKYIVQLEVLSQLRNLQSFVTKQENEMPIIYDLKKDIRFKQGLEEGLNTSKQVIKDFIELKFGSQSYNLFPLIDQINDLEELNQLREICKSSKQLEQVSDYLNSLRTT